MKNYYFIILGLYFTSCTTENIFQPTLLKKIDQLQDSSYFTDISSINFQSESFFLSDRKRGQIFELDTSLNLKMTYGESGDAPFQFEGLPEFAIQDNLIFAINEGKGAINVFKINSKNPIKSIPFPSEFRGSIEELRYFVQDYTIHFSASESQAPLATFDTLGAKILKAGVLFDFNNQKQNLIRNGRNLFEIDNEYLLSISNNMAYIEVYSIPSGDRKQLFEIGKAEPIKERMYFIDNQTHEDNSYYQIFRDVYFVDNKIYLLCISGKEEPVCNSVLVYDFSLDGIQYRETIILPGTWYSSICVTNNLMMAFETTEDKIELFRINQ